MSTKIIDSCIKKLDAMGLDANIGVEVEFYLLKKEHLSLVETKLNSFLENKSLQIKKETSDNQFEMVFSPSSDILQLLNNIIQSRLIVENLLDNYNNKISDFSPKPFLKKPGNGMHFHLNLLDQSGNNAFYLDRSLLMNSIGGLLEITKKYETFFVSNDQEYERIKNHDIHTPQKICWGKNNRTAAIRLIAYKDETLRIEHRLASSTHCPKKTLEILLNGIVHGIANRINPPKPIFGVSSDDIYNLPEIKYEQKQSTS